MSEIWVTVRDLVDGVLNSIGGRVGVGGSCAGSESIPRNQKLSPKMFGGIMMDGQPSLGVQKCLRRSC